MKSAKLEWALDALPEALTLVQEGLTKFQDSDKLWMMKGQLQVKKEQEKQRQISLNFTFSGEFESDRGCSCDIYRGNQDLQGLHSTVDSAGRS